MEFKSFKGKIIIPTVIILTILVIILNTFLAVRFHEINDALVNEKYRTNINTLRQFLTDSEANTKAAAVSMAFNEDNITAIRTRDTSEIIKKFTYALAMYRVDYFVITDEKGLVLARTDESTRLGDSVVNQQNIKDALAGVASTYYEEGTVSKVSIRTGAPVYDPNGAMVGAISAGVRLDSEYAVEKLKALLQSEISVFLGNVRIVTTVTRGGSNIAGTSIDPGIAHIVIDYQREYFGDVDVLGERYKAFYMPLVNAQNKAFATICLAIPSKNLTAAANQSIRGGIILGLCGLGISALSLYFIISTISRPLIQLSNDTYHIASGNLKISFDTTGKDEVGYLSRSLQEVANNLHRLLDGIAVMIDEHEKGNLDFVLETDAFHGDYKVLADNILELANTGMRDQLTGISNRRSFNNRLALEWKRAIRGRYPISILMIDVDHFKDYNDTFGHQQGDVALRAVAKTISESIKRSQDLCARWGGEEFIVLLPETDQAGAVIVAEHVRREIENMLIPGDDARAAKITVSIGTNTCIPTPENLADGLIEAADSALYQAKESGRNAISFYEGGDEV